jgi:hypothetical protein
VSGGQFGDRREDVDGASVVDVEPERLVHVCRPSRTAQACSLVSAGSGGYPETAAQYSSVLNMTPVRWTSSWMELGSPRRCWSWYGEGFA